MNIYQLQANRRSIRKYKDTPIDYNLLEKFVEFARLTASGMNLQPIRYYIAKEKNIIDNIFKHLKWAGYLKGAHSPSFDERPRAYILFLYDSEVAKNPIWDIGAASHAIQLMAQFEQIGSCCLRSINRAEILDICDIDKKYTLDSVLALGYPDESPVVEKVIKGDIKYFLDEEKTLHVPKLSLEEVLIK